MWQEGPISGCIHCYMNTRKPNRASEKLSELFGVSRKILYAFPIASSNELPPEEIESRETALRPEFNTLCVHLISMAAAEIATRGLHEKDHDPIREKIEINDVTCIAVSFLFYRRTDSGLRDIVEIIRSFYRRNHDAGPIDLFNYLTAVVSRTLRQSAKQKARFDNPWYYCIARCVDFHIKSRERYVTKEKLVIDHESNKSNNPHRSATSEDMVALCNNVPAIPKKPGAAIDLIFDRIEESDQFDGKVEKYELYLAVYKLMTPHMTVEYPSNRIPTPEDAYLVSVMHLQAWDILDDMKNSYNWRKMQDDRVRMAFLSAGEDILMDLVYFGERKSSLHEYLAMHMDGLNKKEWPEFKGSFQHFVKVLDEKWAERLRAL